jgi:hypothetical protein
MLKKIITWAVVILIVFWLFMDHVTPLHLINGLASLLKDAGNSLANFVNKDL